jgi:hypothetical protein
VTSEELAENVASVELIWNHEVHTIYFHIPEFISDLSMESRHKVEDRVLDCASQELKLVDFVRQSKILFRESMHQQFLKRYGMSGLWNIKRYITRFMFLNAVVMNVLILLFYGLIDHGIVYNALNPYHVSAAEHSSDDDHHSTDDHSTNSTVPSHGNSTANVTSHVIQAMLTQFRQLSEATDVLQTSPTAQLYLPPVADDVISVLNAVQIILAAATLGIFLAVQVPVTYSSKREQDQSGVLSALLFTALDPLPLWYTIYLGVAIISLIYSRLFLSALLLDWVVLDATTRDLLLAVQYPARQLVATLVIILIFLNIFSGLIFAFYRLDVVGFNIFDMWETLKLCISYGFRGEYGVGHEMTNTLGERLVLDFVFFFIVSCILFCLSNYYLNIFPLSFRFWPFCDISFSQLSSTPLANSERLNSKGCFCLISVVVHNLMICV